MCTTCISRQVTRYSSVRVCSERGWRKSLEDVTTPWLRNVYRIVPLTVAALMMSTCSFSCLSFCRRGCGTAHWSCPWFCTSLISQVTFTSTVLFQCRRSPPPCAAPPEDGSYRGTIHRAHIFFYFVFLAASELKKKLDMCSHQCWALEQTAEPAWRAAILDPSQYYTLSFRSTDIFKPARQS